MHARRDVDHDDADLFAGIDVAVGVGDLVKSLGAEHARVALGPEV
jgi:hypothetical protein